MRVLLAGVAVVALAACTTSAGLKTNAADRSRAAAAAKDPWLALTTTSAPQPAFGSNGWVRRFAGSRTDSSTQSPQAQVQAEVTSALGHGWVLTYVSCSNSFDAGGQDPLAPHPDTVRAQLRRTGGEFNAQVGALIEAKVLSVQGPPNAPFTASLLVQAFVPDHADKSWPVIAPLVSTSTCLTTGALTSQGSVTSVPQTSAPIK